MTGVAGRVAGSATVQGNLWSARARDWAEYLEETMQPLYDAVLQRAALEEGTELLDAGCGAGLFCWRAGLRGANVQGLDAAAALLAIARERLPEVEFREGDLEEMPYDDGSFDVVTGFNSFQYAVHPVAALREAARVARPGASVFIATWGRADDCEAAAYLAALASLVPPPPGAVGPFALSEPGVLDALARDAGLDPLETVDVPCEWRYPDLEVALRALLSPGPAERAIRVAGEARVRDVVKYAIRPFRTSRGGYQIENTFRILIARA